MQPLQPFYIVDPQGLETDIKPFLLPDQAYQTLENAYVFRGRVLKRQGISLLGRLQRNPTITEANANGTGTYTTDLLSSVRATEPNAEIKQGSITITIGDTTYKDNVTPGIMTYIGGTFTITSGTINYVTGIVTLNFTVAPGGGTGVTAVLNYFPALPVMGIPEQETANINQEQTIFFDTKYAYIFNGSSFQEFIPGTTWAGTDSDFFWSTNFLIPASGTRLFFTTNFVNDVNDPIRYTSGGSWTNFTPLVSATNSLFQARILLPYFGRMIALNVWEGVTGAGPVGAINIPNRCSFSAIGDPTQVDAWRRDIFGKGGSIDAPVNEQIISASYFKNTLIVDFERSTWQLRYVGEYGLPFIWERISSDFGSDSTFSTVLFDEGNARVGYNGITAATAVSCSRIDEKIPDIVFGFANANNGQKRIQGIRDYQKELVYWCFPNSTTSNVYPDTVLVYNYRNHTWSTFRDNITCFGFIYNPNAITWSSQTVTWDDMDVTWDDADNQINFPFIIIGNQQGFVHTYGYATLNDPSLAITAMNLTVTPNTLTIPNHNLLDGEIIYVTGCTYVTPPTTDINNNIFRVSVIDSNNISLSTWNFASQNYFSTPAQSAVTYLGGGQVTLFPKLFAQTKDFNPYQTKGKQMRLAYIDFLTDATPDSSINVQIFANASPAVQCNLLVGNTYSESALSQYGNISNATQGNPCVITSVNHGLANGQAVNIFNVGGMTQLNGNTYLVQIVDNDNFSLENYLTGAPIDSTGFTAYTTGGIWIGNFLPYAYFTPASQYAWHRFYAPCVGQYLNVAMTYDDNLMNTLSTHQQSWVLNAFTLYAKEAGKIIF